MRRRTLRSGWSSSSELLLAEARLRVAAFFTAMSLALTIALVLPGIVNGDDGGTDNAGANGADSNGANVENNAKPAAIEVQANHSLSGRQLFEIDFRMYEGFREGEGIGPMFNEVSCVACHNQGALGGGGGLKHNVDIVSFNDRTLERQNPNALARIHPAFTSRDGDFVPSLLLHRFSTDARYPELREEFLGKSWIKVEDNDEHLQTVFERHPVRTVRPVRDITLLHSQRNTPALFGSGMLELIPEELLWAQAARDKKFGVKGRVSQLSGGKVGRFGWRAQLPTVRAFVLSACANELGLEVEDHSQARNPHESGTTQVSPEAALLETVGGGSVSVINLFTEAGPVINGLTIEQMRTAMRIRQDANMLELRPEDTNAMIQFVSSISTPDIHAPEEIRNRALNGLQVFNEVGCAECHVRHMGPARNVFSDLLLHDLGDGLADPVGASREVETVSTPNPEGTGTRKFFKEPTVVDGYSVGTVTVPQFSEEPNREDRFTDVIERFAETRVDPRNEWRTPPLWGCADSAPYMHDGRAATLDEAIRKHRGESRRVRSNYARLEQQQRDDLLVFLNCLKAPDQ